MESSWILDWLVREASLEQEEVSDETDQDSEDLEAENCSEEDAEDDGERILFWTESSWQ